MFENEKRTDPVGAARTGAYLPHSKVYEVKMPSLKKSATNSTLSFGLETLSTIVSEQDVLSNLAKKMAFVTVKQAGGLVANVVISEFFDTALADMLDTFGDTSLSAATRALREAAAESSAEVRRRHRHTAEGLLRLAFEGYEKSISARRAKFFTVIGDKDVVLHGKAIQIAMTIAAISQEIGAAATMESWIDSSKKHFAKMTVIIQKERDDSVAEYNKRFGKRITLGALTDPYPMQTEFTMRHRAEVAMARATKLDADVQRWVVLVRQLRARS
jgi:hypothetical protein